MQTTLVLIVVAAGVALYLWRRKKRFDENRPEIVVTNGKLRIRTGKDWIPLGSAMKWKPDHPEGKSVRAYIVTVENAQEAACNGMLMTGDSVIVVYHTNSTVYTITLALERDASINEPIVRAVDLEHDGGNRKQLKIAERPLWCA